MSITTLIDIYLNERVKRMKLDVIEREQKIFNLNGINFYFYVRDPSTKQRVKYMASQARKQLGKIQDKYEQLFAAKFISGCEIITGFPEFFPLPDGTDKEKISEPQFEIDGKPISSDPKSDNYREDWKELILPKFFNQIIYLASEKYEGINVQDKAKEFKDAEDDEIQEMDDESPLLINTSSK